MSATLSRLAFAAALWAGAAHAQVARFPWLAEIDAQLPAIEACTRAAGDGPFGVAALRVDGSARHLLLRDAAALVWSCVYRDGRTQVALETDPASERHRRPVFWLARFGEPWAECWDAEPVRRRDGTLAGWFAFQTC